MKSTRVLALAAISATIAVPTAVWAQQQVPTPVPAKPVASASASGLQGMRTIQFAAHPNSPEDGIVRGLYAPYLKKAGIVLETALVDVDGDGKAQIAARFNTPEQCSGTGVAARCNTVILKYDPNAKRWFDIMSTPIASLEVGPAQKGAPAVLLANGAEWWQANPDGRYAATLYGQGNDVGLDGVVSTAQFKAAVSALGASAVGAKLDNAAVGLLVPQPGFTIQAVVLNGAVGCMPTTGCPTALLQTSPSNELRAVGTALVDNRLVIMRKSTQGMQDIGIPEVSGYSVMRWNGSSYKLTSSARGQ